MRFAAAVSMCLLSLSGQANVIMPPAQGLTLAQITEADGPQTLAVIEDTGDAIRAINISRLGGVDGDIVQVYRTLGRRAIVELVTDHQPAQLRDYPYSRLSSPAGTASHHIALGFNYAAHAEEVEEEDQPFLFLKTIAPTREQRIVADDQTLLDYEAEICARPLMSLSYASDRSRVAFGFFLCGDFTDRAELLRGIDLDDMQSGRGFNAAKSREGYFPTGPYMVIPANNAGFLDDVSFSLYRQNELRQRSSTAKMIWPLDVIIERIFSAQVSRRPTHAQGMDNWLAGNVLSTDTVILTGTPEGVIMRPPSLGYRIASGLPYVFSGAMFTMSVRDYVIQRYTRDLLEQKTFLQPGERIVLEGSYLGRLTVAIADRPEPGGHFTR